MQTVTNDNLFEEDQMCSKSTHWLDFSNYSDEQIAEFNTPRHKRIIYLHILPAVLFVGLLGNCAFIFVIVRLKRMRTITNFYLTNLAIADVSYLTVGVSEKVTRTILSPIDNDQGMYGHAACVTIYSVMNTASFASLFLVTLVTLEKFYAVCYPLKHRRVTGRRRTIKLVSFCWMLAIAFAATLIPSFWSVRYVCSIWPNSAIYDDYPSYIGACWSVSDLAVNVAHGVQTIPFFLVSIPNIVMYVKIVGTLHKRVATSDDMSSSREQNQRMRNTVARMLVVNGTLFFILAAPFHIISFILMVSAFSSSESLSAGIIAAVPICQLLLYMNSAINPFVFSATNSRYRQAYWRAFCWSSLKIVNADRDKNCQSSIRINTISTAI